jgi:hypothetical protein
LTTKRNCIQYIPLHGFVINRKIEKIYFTFTFDMIFVLNY